MHVINGYRLTTPWTTVGGGQCQWAFAERGGVHVFIKRFLAPRYPVEGSPGSAETNARKLARCIAFERHHEAVIRALRHRCAAGGNLVVARDFFREGTSYYKVTDRVDDARLTTNDIAALPLSQLVLLLKTVTHSVAILHEANLIHADLRPENVLVKRAPVGATFISKLIDLDSCFFSEAPPPPDLVTADPLFIAPETSRYTAATDPDPRIMTVKADIFSLGLLFAVFTLGSSAFEAFASHGAQYAHEFAATGHAVPLPWERLPAIVAPLVRRMLAAEPANRPTARGALDALKGARTLTPPANRLRGVLVATPRTVERGGLRGSLVPPRR